MGEIPIKILQYIYSQTKSDTFNNKDNKNTEIFDEINTIQEEKEKRRKIDNEEKEEKRRIQNLAKNLYTEIITDINEKNMKVIITNILNEYLDRYESGIENIDYVKNFQYEILNKITEEQASSIKEYISHKKTVTSLVKNEDEKNYFIGDGDNENASILNTILILQDLKLQKVNEYINKTKNNDKDLNLLKKYYKKIKKQNDLLKKIINQMIINKIFYEEDVKTIIYLTINSGIITDEKWNSTFNTLQENINKQNKPIGGKKTKNKKTKNKKTKNKKTKNKKTKKITN
jgi:ribosomal protein S25